MHMTKQVEMNLKKTNTTILHFHTDFLRIPQFQLLSLSRWLAETGDSRWATAVTSCPIRPLQHHDVRRHFYTDCGTPQKPNFLTSICEHKDTKQTKQKVYRCISTFSPWMRPAALEEVCFQSASQQTGFAEISVQVHSGSLFTHRSSEGRPFRSLAQESVSVMAKHSSASRHWRGFTGSVRIQLCPR